MADPGPSLSARAVDETAITSIASMCQDAVEGLQMELNNLRDRLGIVLKSEDDLEAVRPDNSPSPRTDMGRQLSVLYGDINTCSRIVQDIHTRLHLT